MSASDRLREMDEALYFSSSGDVGDEAGVMLEVWPELIDVVLAAEKQRKDGYTLASCKRTSAALERLAYKLEGVRA